MSRRHDDVHYPMQGRGQRARKPKSSHAPPVAMLVPDNQGAGGKMSYIANLHDTIRELRAEIELLRDVIWRNCDPMAMTAADAAVVEDIARLKALEEK